MKGFAILILVLCTIAALLGLLETFLGNGMEQVQGVSLLGSGVTGVLLSCVVILLADIRSFLAPKA